MRTVVLYNYGVFSVIALFASVFTGSKLNNYCTVKEFIIWRKFSFIGCVFEIATFCKAENSDVNCYNKSFPTQTLFTFYPLKVPLCELLLIVHLKSSHLARTRRSTKTVRSRIPRWPIGYAPHHCTKVGWGFFVCGEWRSSMKTAPTVCPLFWRAQNTRWSLAREKKKKFALG